MNTLDLTFLSVYRINGQELPQLPGLLAVNPPKKTARGREQDRLIVYLTLAGNVSISDAEYTGIVNQVADTFYNTPGSLTFALKTAAAALNTYLVERNMKSTGKGLYSMGALVLCNLRGNSLYIVQSGPTHVYHLNDEIRHFHDPLLAGKGLGLSQTARMYFAQVNLSAGDRLLLCAALPPTWEKSIAEIRGSSALETTRRRLLATADTNISALLIKATDGAGAMTILSPSKDASPEPASRAVVESRPSNEPAAPVEDKPVLEPPAAEIKSLAADLPPVESMPIETVETPPAEAMKEPGPTIAHPDDASGKATSSYVPSLPTLTQPEKPSGSERTASSAAEAVSQKASAEKLRSQLRDGARNLAGMIQKGRESFKKFIAWSEKAIPRLLPESADGERPAVFSRSWAIFLAIAIPVLIFIAARVVYSQWGFEAQYNIYYARAAQAAQQALTASSPTALRVEWQAVLDQLDRADQYQDPPSAESQNLRGQAQTALDNLDKVVRANFAPAFASGLGRNVQVTRIVANESDVYLLDSQRGSVIRGVYTGRNFEIDNNFECGAGYYSGFRVDKLIDMVALPRAVGMDATLLGIDISGNLLYCGPGEAPRAASLQMPDTGWKSITAVAYDNYTLYVLDAPARAVWVYHADDKLGFTDKPFFFFEEQVPVMLEQATGLAINNDDLYLLHLDGHLTTCTFSNILSSPTRCNDPAIYNDTRPGYQGGMKLSDGVFTQIAFTPPPDPSVAMLEPYSQSIFRFSPSALELQNQVRAVGKDNPLPRGVLVTAMAFSPNKLLFMYIDGQLYFSSNVP